MDITRPTPIGFIKRTGFEEFDRKTLPDLDLQSISIYSTSVDCLVTTSRKVKKKRRKYQIELYHYDGFGMVKFYPKCQKNNPNKYKVRGMEIGYSLNFVEIRKILMYCALVMKSYLDDNPDHFIGYIGQTDNKDNLESNMRSESQRASIYDRYTSSIFTLPKYSLSSKEMLGEINMKLIRRAQKHKELTLTDNQKKNYKCFMNFLEKKRDLIPELMTEKTKKKYYPNLFDI